MDKKIQIELYAIFFQQISRSTTPLEDASGTPFISPAGLNYVTSSQMSTHSIASLTGPDKPYKPKFHKAVFYHSNANINNDANSTVSSKDSKSSASTNRRHEEEISQNLTMSHTLVRRNQTFLS